MNISVYNAKIKIQCAIMCVRERKSVCVNGLRISLFKWIEQRKCGNSTFVLERASLLLTTLVYVCLYFY